FHAHVTEITGRQCRLDGSTVRLAARCDGLTVGSSAVVVVRPERVRIAHPTAAVNESADNLATGTLTDTIYLGNSRRYIVRLASSQEVSITRQDGTGPAFDRGQTVQLSWGIEDALALPDES